MPYLISTGTVTNGKKIPMYILARLNLNGQGISVANIYKKEDETLKAPCL
jgi:nitrate/nitrite transport system substrate-binding protein